jgi:hypothetical protein
MVTVPAHAPAWARQLADDVSRELRAQVRGFPVVLAKFSKTDLPDATRWEGSWIFVTDDAGGAVPAYAQGGDWKRADTSAVIS